MMKTEQIINVISAIIVGVMTTYFYTSFKNMLHINHVYSFIIWIVIMGILAWAIYYLAHYILKLLQNKKPQP
ncbi:hypothetical protein [Lactobacillus terrae]|uniref:hypothetical protein n=1 Tax=Lactobacillus terrae TaxID=2269374 RepID=UPI000C1B73CF|nr:hypothetical protein [Lactobacillus terrae]